MNSTNPMPPTLQFQEIPIGQFFEYRGRRYRKLALSMASDEDRNGNIFQAQTEVLPDPFTRSDPGPEPIDHLNTSPP
jgi:hypothetical protein